MREIMGWGACAEHIRKVEPDLDKIESIIKMCKARMKVLVKVVLDDETASIIASDYYEVIKELLVALLLKAGLKSDNHECLISYFRNKFPERGYEAGIIHQLKDVRNRAVYDGVFVKKDYIERNSLEFSHIIDILFGLLK